MRWNNLSDENNNQTNTMSGGHFDFKQYQIEYIAEEIDDAIEKNDDETLNEWGGRRGNGYPPEVIEKFREAAHTLRQAAEMAQRIDWLLSNSVCFLFDSGRMTTRSRKTPKNAPAAIATKNANQYEYPFMIIVDAM